MLTSPLETKGAYPLRTRSPVCAVGDHMSRNESRHAVAAGLEAIVSEDPLAPSRQEESVAIGIPAGEAGLFGGADDLAGLD
jgi:hypothetical protein